MAEGVAPPEGARHPVAKIGGRVRPDDVETYVRKKEARDRGHYVRTLVGAWKEQQAEDRKLRNRYAIWLLRLLTAQVVALHVLFVLLGCGRLTVERWTASTFITASFAEVVSLVVIVVKSLFPAAGQPLPTFDPRPSARRDTARDKGRRGAARA